MKTPLITLSKRFLRDTVVLSLTVFMAVGCTHRHAGLKLGQEQEPPGEKQTIGKHQNAPL